MKCIGCNKVIESAFPGTRGQIFCRSCKDKEVISFGSEKDTEPSDIIVSNELLAYVQHYADSSSFDSLKKLLLEYYNPDEIKNAKQVLWKSCNHLLPPIEKRVKSSSRSAHEAEVYDILNAFKKLDGEESSYPTFASVDLNRLPKHGPEELDMVDMLERIQALEHSQKLYEKRVCKNTDSIETLFKIHNDSHSFAAKVISPSHVEKSNKERSTNDDVVGIESVWSLEEQSSKVPKAQLTSSKTLNTDSIVQSQANKFATSSVDNLERTMPWVRRSEGIKVDDRVEGRIERSKGPHEQDGDNKEEFQLSTREMKKRRQQVRQTAVYGTSETQNGLKGAPHNKDIFVFRLDKNTSETQVKDYMYSKNIESVSKIECISHQELKFKSFRVTVLNKDLNIIMDPSFWPQNVGCRLFIRRIKPVKLDNGATLDIDNSING